MNWEYNGLLGCSTTVPLGCSIIKKAEDWRSIRFKAVGFIFGLLDDVWRTNDAFMSVIRTYNARMTYVRLIMAAFSDLRKKSSFVNSTELYRK